MRRHRRRVDEPPREPAAVELRLRTARRAPRPARASSRSRSSRRRSRRAASSWLQAVRDQHAAGRRRRVRRERVPAERRGHRPARDHAVAGEVLQRDLRRGLAQRARRDLAGVEDRRTLGARSARASPRSRRSAAARRRAGERAGDRARGCRAGTPASASPRRRAARARPQARRARARAASRSGGAPARARAACPAPRRRRGRSGRAGSSRCRTGRRPRSSSAASAPPLGTVTKKSSSRVERSRARWTSMKPPPPGPVSGDSVTHDANARRDGRVDRVAAAREHACAGLGGHGMSGCDCSAHTARSMRTGPRDLPPRRPDRPPGLPRPALGRAARGVGLAAVRRGRARHRPPRRALRRLRRLAVRAQGAAAASRAARVPVAARARRGRPAGGRRGRRRQRARRERGVRADHALPRVLAPVPARADPRRASGAAAAPARRVRGAARAPAPAGFFWGDCSLSNTLFRRDAGKLSAYLVDAETAELHEQLSDGSADARPRARAENLYGELLDVGHDDDAVRPRRRRARAVSTGCGASSRTRRCSPRTSASVSSSGCTASTTSASTWRRSSCCGRETGYRLRLRSQVVEPGHHRRRLLQLTGLRAQENQARRLLEDIEVFRAELEAKGEPRDLGGVARGPLAQRRLRARGRRDPVRALGQARGGRALPRAARAPLVPVRAQGPRRRP